MSAQVICSCDRVVWHRKKGEVGEEGGKGGEEAGEEEEGEKREWVVDQAKPPPSSLCQIVPIVSANLFVQNSLCKICKHAKNCKSQWFSCR